MISSVLALTIAQPATGRFDMALRLQRLEGAWLAQTAVEARRKAVAPISRAVSGFFASDYASACRGLDEAWAALEKREPNQTDAITHRASPMVAEPGEKVEIIRSFAYMEAGKQTAPSVAVSLMAQGRDGLKRENLEVGQTKFSVQYSVVKSGLARIEAIKAKNPSLGAGLESLWKRGRDGSLETSLDIAKGFSEAEKWSTRPMGQWRGGDILLAESNRSWLRAWLPNREPKAVVIALHGAGGSENMFFDGYGQGLALREAKKRGWAFIAPRSTATAVRNSLAWLKEQTGHTPRQVFLMGHSMGGGLALASGDTKPAATALFAPAAQRLPGWAEKSPIFLSVGKQEMMMLRGGVNEMKKQLNSDSVFVEKDPCEHLMIVADALPEAYRFFDRFAK